MRQLETQRNRAGDVKNYSQRGFLVGLGEKDIAILIWQVQIICHLTKAARAGGETPTRALTKQPTALD